MKCKKANKRRSSRGRERVAVTHHRVAGNVVRISDVKIEPTAPSRWPAVSVCMIVKNEEENLRPCLESLGDFAAEIIVVDTGSTDNTIAIAQEMGAKVYHFQWIDDFAAARNESLRHATKDWIFWMDADDRLKPETLAQLKRAVSTHASRAYICTVCSTTTDGGEDFVEHIRLFPNHIGIRFARPIHETPLPDIVRVGLPLVRTDIVIHHLGYAAAQDASRRKSQRNLEIIERELNKDPKNLDLLFYRGQARGGLGDYSGAETDMREYLARTSATNASVSWQRSWCYIALARILDRRRDMSAMQPLLKDALAEFPDDAHFQLLQARLYLTNNEPDKALPLLVATNSGLDRPARGYRPPREWVELSLAECTAALGRREDALYWAELAHKHAPHWVEAGTLLARHLIEAARLREAEEVLVNLSRTSPNPEPWAVLAELRFKQGRTEEANEAMQEAQVRGLPAADAAARLMNATKTQTVVNPKDARLQRRGLALIAQEEYLEAAECFGEAIESDPSNPDNYKYLAVTLKKLGHEKEAQEAWRLSIQFQKNAV